MQKSDKPLKAVRYRSYFWLMNVCTLAIIIALANPGTEYLFGLDIDEALPTPARILYFALVWIGVLLVPAFLICARFMRDDYSEALWRRSVAVLAYATAILPFVLFVAEWSLYFALGQPAKAPAVMRWAEAKVEWGTAIQNVWVGYMMLFVASFQFLRWRDAR